MLCPKTNAFFNSIRTVLTSAGATGTVGFKPVDGYVDASTRDYAVRYKINNELRDKVVQLREQAMQAGSANAINRHTKQLQKILVRNRLRLLLDRDSKFLEIGTLVGHDDSLPGTGAGIVCGIGQIRGRQVMLTAQDATVKGGALYPIGLRKQMRTMRLSRQLRIPNVVLVDSAGAFLPLQSEIFPDRNHGGRLFRNEAVYAADGIPQLSIVVGACTAGGAYTPTMMDNAIIVDKIGHVFLGGPPLVKAALGEVVSAEDLGGAMVHCSQSGATDYFAQSEPEAYEMARDLIETVKYEPRYIQPGAVANRRTTREPMYNSTELVGLAGSTVIGREFVFQIISRIFDNSECLEFRTLYGQGLVCGWARLNGSMVGLIAATGSKICSRSAEKAAQLAQMCDEAATPLVILPRTLHDGWAVYDAFDLKAHAQLMSVLATCAVPRIAINVGHACGADYFALGGRAFDPVFHFSWPNAAILNEMPETADEIHNQNSLESAASNCIDDIILPEETREVLLRCLECIPLVNETQGRTRVMRL